MGKEGSLAQGLARDPGARLFCAFWASMVVADVVAALRAPASVAVGGMALVVLLASRHQHLATAVAVATIGWLFLNGVYENRVGELHWHGTADVRALLVLLAAAAVGSMARIDVVSTRERRHRVEARVGAAGVRRTVRIGE